MTAAIDINKINTVISSYQHTEKTIIEGSDEHLDLILDVQNDLIKMTEVTQDLVGDIERDFNLFNEETAKNAVIKIFPCFRMADHIIDRLKGFFIYPSIIAQVNNFEAEVNELKEFVSDLSRYKVQQNDDLIALFNDEN
jgi:hypothetical protein